MHNKYTLEGDISISIRLYHFFPFPRWRWPISPNFIKLGFRSELSLPPLPPFWKIEKADLLPRSIFSQPAISDFSRRYIKRRCICPGMNKRKEKHRACDKRAEPSIGQSYVCICVSIYICIGKLWQAAVDAFKGEKLHRKWPIVWRPEAGRVG